MGRIPHGRDTKEFREEAARLVLEDGLSAGEAAQRPSLSRRGDCYDNAPIESFWGTLKTELTFHRHYQTRQEQKKLGYLSPAAYERRFYQMQKAA